MSGKVRERRPGLAYGVVGLTAALIFFIDFSIKAYLLTNFAYRSIPVLKDIFHITVIFNTGAAFGILKGNTNLLTCLGIVFVGLFIFFIKKEEKKNLIFLIACGLILGGALSNLYDRIFLGFVVDYIDLRIWPVFNLSDSGISIGVAVLLLQSLINGKKNNS